MNNEVLYDTNGTEAPPFPKADFLNRSIAKFIDFIIMWAFFVFPSFVGPLAGTTYILISDGLNGGQSLGKRIIGLRVAEMGTNDPCDFKKSIIRNSPFAILILFWFIVGWIPYVGKLMNLVAWTAVIGIEAILVYTDERGARFGDRIAETVVVPSKGH